MAKGQRGRIDRAVPVVVVTGRLIIPRVPIGLFAVLALLAWSGVATAQPRHGIAMHGEPALPAGFTQFPHVNPQPPRGGRLTLGVQGTFDSLNPYSIKGSPAQGLRDLVFESLMARSPDEPFTLYGLIAETIEVPPDRGSVTFHLRPEARFSDGRPITAEDVVFSQGLLKEKGLAYHRAYYKKVVRAEAPDAHTVRFEFDTAGDRELPLIMGLMPVLPRHKYTLASFERATNELPVGSGPYVVASVDAGRSITYRARPDHWARHLAVLKGRFNFDEVRYDYYRDANALFEAFKTGDIDARPEDDPSRWAQGYRIAAVSDGRIAMREFPTGLPAGMSAFVFNTRRPVFADPRVRRALIAAFDFNWINRNLYHSLLTRTESLFQRSYLASTGRAADAAERALLAPYPDAVSPAILDGTFRFPDGSDSGNRDNLRRASELLQEAGYVIDGETLVDARTRAPLRFEFLARTRAQERLMLTYRTVLQRLGITVSIRQVDDAQYWARLKNFDFDMIQWNWLASLSPGNEQSNRWSSIAADVPGSLNFAGVRSPAADAMIDAMLRATTADAFASAVRALDRVILSGDYMIPLFHVQGQWIAYWRRVRPPERTALFGSDFDTWWRESEKP